MTFTTCRFRTQVLYKGNLRPNNAQPFSDINCQTVNCDCWFTWFLLYLECNMYTILICIYLTEVFLNLTGFSYPDWCFYVFFPKLYVKCQEKTRKEGARPALFHISSYLCFSFVFVLFYVLFVCKCVLPLGDNAIAVNKYAISYHRVIPNDDQPMWIEMCKNVLCYDLSI
jgi:hypothetical protein